MNRISLLTLALTLAVTPVPAHAAEFGLLGFDVRAGVAIPDELEDNGFALGASLKVAEFLNGFSLHPVEGRIVSVSFFDQFQVLGGYSW